jgi:Gram-negative bacterial TonB protein C-terminal
MKLLFSFGLFFPLFLSAQIIDCQQFKDMSKPILGQLGTIKTHSISYKDNSDTIELTAFFNTQKNLYTIVNMRRNPANRKKEVLAMMPHTIEMIAIGNKTYGKSNKDTVWTYEDRDTVMEKSLITNRIPKDVQFKNCQIIGNEKVDSDDCKVISVEAVFTEPDTNSNQYKFSKMQYWLREKDSIVVKTLASIKQQGTEMTMTIQYNVPFEIQIPANAKPRIDLTAPQNRSIPSYKGGYVAQYRFLEKNTRKPQAAKDLSIKGNVALKFFVDIDGSVRDIKVVKGLGYGCDEEAIRLVAMTSCDWYPALKLGKPIRAEHSILISFR